MAAAPPGHVNWLIWRPNFMRRIVARHGVGVCGSSADDRDLAALHGE
jgi:hypothetical protein